MKKIEHVLFVDESEVNDDAALQQAIRLAESNSAKLTVVGCYKNLKHVMQAQPSTGSVIADMVARKRHDLLNKVKQLSGDLVIEVKVFTGKPFIDIINEAVDYEADMVIKPIEPSGFKNSLFGSQDLKLLRMCPCPLWLVKSTEQIGEKQFVVAIDYEPENPENVWVNKQLLDYGVTLARSRHAELHVVHSWTSKSAQLGHKLDLHAPNDSLTDVLATEKQQRADWLEKTVDDCLNAYGKTTQKYLSPKLHLLEGHAVFTLPEMVNELKAELLIMGTVGRTGIPGFIIGNTAEAVLFNIDCSVLAIKPAGFISPVRKK